MLDTAIEKLIKEEEGRQQSVVNLIASENIVSRDVLEALGSVLTNKYAEGYPGARYYGGNQVIDEVERLAQQRALQLFNLDPAIWAVNVQPLSGSPANLAVYMALVPVGEKIMGMKLDMGGHLTHGQKVSASGKLWHQVAYGVDQKTEVLDFDILADLAHTEKPKLIVAGFTAYPRLIDFGKFREIADSCGAYLMVDMAHIAGLVAGGVHPSPFLHADVVTTTTHKTLRGPRGAMIFSRKDKTVISPNGKEVSLATAIDKVVFPGLQGGPHENQIAAIAVALHEAIQPEFRAYVEQIVANTKALASGFESMGFRIVSGGTDNHLFLVDTWQKEIGGKDASNMLEQANIILNMNTIPFDTRKPFDPSGVRIGTATATTRGMKEGDMKVIAGFVERVLLKKEDPALTKKDVIEFVRSFPVFSW